MRSKGVAFSDKTEMTLPPPVPISLLAVARFDIGTGGYSEQPSAEGEWSYASPPSAAISTRCRSLRYRYWGLLRGQPSAEEINTKPTIFTKSRLFHNKGYYLVFPTKKKLFENEFNFNNGTSLSAGIDLIKDNQSKTSTVGLGLRYNF